MSEERRALARRIHKVGEARAEAAKSNFVGEIIKVDPLQVELAGSNIVLDEDEGLVQTQKFRQYAQRVGLSKGDSVLVDHRQDDWYLIDVVADDDPVEQPVIPARTMAGWTNGANRKTSIDRSSFTDNDLFDFIATLVYDMREAGLIDA